MSEKEQESNRFRESSDQVEIFAQLMKTQLDESGLKSHESAEQKELNNSKLRKVA